MPNTGERQSPTLSELALVLLRDANLTLGGGTATSEVIRRSLMRRGWLTDDEHRRLYALSRLTPGTNLLAYCTAVGWHIKGAPGAVTALLVASLPCSLVAIVIMALYDTLAASRWFAIILLLGMSIALLLLVVSAWHLAKPLVTRSQAARSLVITLFVAVLALLRVSPILTLLIAGAIGALWPTRS